MGVCVIQMRRNANVSCVLDGEEHRSRPAPGLLGMLSTSTSTDDIIAHEANHAPGSWPIYIDECFGWLHMPVGTRGASTAVLLCAGFKEDKVSGHRSLRLLADALATAGYPTLRFDYAGAGDSRDIGTTEPWATWQQNTHVAADWLRQRSGASRIILCGLRLGATLAALAAEARDDVAGLVLFAPVLRGRTYLRQIAVEARTGQTRAADDGLTLDDVCLSSETVDAIKAVDLRKVAVPSGCKVLIHAQETSPILSECIAAWVARGVDVEHKDFTKFEAMLRPYFMSHEADAEVSSVSDWLRPRFPPGPGISPLPGLPHSESLRVDGYVETPLRFGSNEHLFAVLCRPFGRPEASVAVVIPNSSGAPHYGNARAGVDLARRLAASGIASLRIDFDGLGDSGAPDGLPTHVFETDRKSDVAAAVDVLEQLGFRRCVMLGLCSGAYHALQATLADTRINLQVLVNLPLFQWRERRSHRVDGLGQREPNRTAAKILPPGPPRLAGSRIAREPGRVSDTARVVRATDEGGGIAVGGPVGPADALCTSVYDPPRTACQDAVPLLRGGRRTQNARARIWGQQGTAQCYDPDHA